MTNKWSHFQIWLHCLSIIQICPFLVLLSMRPYYVLVDLNTITIFGQSQYQKMCAINGSFSKYWILKDDQELSILDTKYLWEQKNTEGQNKFPDTLQDVQNKVLIDTGQVSWQEFKTKMLKENSIRCIWCIIIWNLWLHYTDANFRFKKSLSSQI